MANTEATINKITRNDLENNTVFLSPPATLHLFLLARSPSNTNPALTRSDKLVRASETFLTLTASIYRSHKLLPHAASLPSLPWLHAELLPLLLTELALMNIHD